MPKFLEKKLKQEYGNDNDSAVYGTMNKLGYMHGNKETAKGAAAQSMHDNKMKTVKTKKKSKKIPPPPSGLLGSMGL